jgi:lipoprotein-anchoring transpeptidase ErfK/SrfK
MSKHTYSQKSGIFSNGDTGTSTHSYSGKKGVTDQTKKNEGPIPIGTYTITNSCENNKERCNLQPDTSNNMFGRNAFQIHGDNGKNDQSASNGCIILNTTDRKGLKKGDKVEVTE